MSRDFRELGGRDAYALLGLDEDADAQEIKRAWRAMSRRHHADVGGSDNVQSLLNVAYDTLSDPALRTDYDRYRHTVLLVGAAGRPPVHEPEPSAYEPPPYVYQPYEPPPRVYEPPPQPQERPAHQPPRRTYVPPSYAPPAKKSAGHAPPARETPDYAPPAYESASHAPPAYESAGHASPAHEASAHEAPADEAPAHEAAGYAPPAHEAPPGAAARPPVRERPRPHRAPAEDRDLPPEPDEWDGWAGEEPQRRFESDPESPRHEAPAPFNAWSAPRQADPRRDFISTARPVGYDNLAIVSLVLALVFAPAALVTAPLALYRIRRSGAQGRALAITALVLVGVLTIALTSGYMIGTRTPVIAH